MTGTVPAYLVAASAMLFAACSALTLIYAVNHFDPPETPSEKPASEVKEPELLRSA